MYNLHILLDHLNISYFIIIDLALGISDTDITLISLASSRAHIFNFSLNGFSFFFVVVKYYFVQHRHRYFGCTQSF